ncbi:MAG TPA: ATP-binding protein [Candidatus Saccharimonadales bacterium]|nr:ATP-binding protein [Candidatus Saccharimonadales bacterium]
MFDHLMHPIVILVRGLPGSGKSYMAERLADAIGRARVVLLDPDATDYESEAYKKHVKAQLAEGVDPKLHAYRFLRAQAYQGIADRKVVIWNQPFTNLDIFHKMVANFRAQAAGHHTELRVLVVEVMLDPAVAKERVARRKREGGHGPSDAVFARFVDDYMTFANDGYDVVTVRGDAPVAQSVATVLQAVQDLVQ